MAKTIYLAKANDKLVSHCRCKGAEALITEPPQMDCPWCGCGWLFSCMRCRRAFTFARGVEVDESLEELSRRSLAGRGGPEVDEEAVQGWVGLMEQFLDGVEPGEEYVVLDLMRIPVDFEPPLRFRGVFADHDLPFVPQVRALQDKSIIDELLANEEYWLERHYEDEE